MKQHFSITEINDIKLIEFSGELQSVYDYLKSGDKLVGICYCENEYRVIEISEFFDFKKYDVINKNLTIIIDRNILISAREFYKKRSLEKVRHIYFAHLLAYGIFTNSIFDPTIAVYEGGSSDTYSALEDIRSFRIMDNLKFDTMISLLNNEISEIPYYEIERAKRIMKPINSLSAEEDYKKKLDLFRRNYPYMLQATLLLRKPGLSLYQKIKYFFEWMMNEYVTKSEAIIFAMYCFNKNGGVIKDFNTLNYKKLIDSIKNATWDLTLITYLKNQARKKTNRYFLLATEDMNLLSASRYFFAPDESQIDGLLGSKKEAVHKIICTTNEVCSLPERESLIIERLSRLDEIIESLELDLNLNCVSL